MARATDILSRVYRNLRRHGIPTESLQDQEIFDELILGQDRIISEIFPDKIITITLVNNQDTYNLTTNSPPSSGPNNIASVKIAQLPSGWANSDNTSDFNNITSLPKGFTVIPNTDFVDFVNKHPDMEGRPRIATIIDNKLKVYPIPTAEEDGKEIKLYVYISSSAGIIDDNNEPEIPEYFDKALENYATSQFLAGQERAQYLSEFASDLTRLMAIQNRKHHTLSRKSITGFI